MTRSSVSLIYSAALGTLRRVVLPSNDDAELDHDWNMPGRGEARVLVRISEYVAAGGVSGCQALVNTHTGRVPEPFADRFVIIDSDGMVVSAIVADPACGVPVPPGHALVQHPEATQGWAYRDGVWLVPIS